MNNYIPDVNRFKLAAPPDWWLRKLHDFDPSLYVVPSRQGFFYRLAQKRPLNLTAKMVNDLIGEQSDTKMLASYSLIPVTTILGNPHWSDAMFAELEARAPWRLGGAQKVIQNMEDREFEAHKRVIRETDESNTDAARMAWKSYQYRTGQRTFVNKEKARMAPDIKGYQRTQAGILLPPA